MTLNEYAAAIVLPTIREFLDDRANKRRAVLACIAAYHTADYLAELRVPGDLSKKKAKEAHDTQTQKVRDAVKGVCASALAVVQGICNGTKHADPFETKSIPMFGYGTPRAGWGQGRWSVPGLEVEHNGQRLFVDHSVQVVMLTLRALYGADLDPLDMTFFDVAFRGQPGRKEPPSGPAV